MTTENGTNHIMAKARKIFLEDYAEVKRTEGLLRPTKNESPIFPPWMLEEYAAMEKDKAKYFLYYSAIQQAMEHLAKEGGEFDCMIVGAGGGRLVEYCYTHMRDLELKGNIHVVEVNRTANSMLKSKFSERKNILVHPAIPIRTAEEIRVGISKGICGSEMEKLTEKKSVKLFVSELFGSLGDNEFVAEILSASVELFATGDDFISIPHSYTIYTCPISSPTLDKHFSMKEGGCYPAILGMPEDAVYLSDVEKVYTSLCFTPSKVLTGKISISSQRVKSIATAESKLSGFAVFFTAVLYGDVVIDTRPGSGKNTYFWESGFLMVSKEAKQKWDNFILESAECDADRTHSFTIQRHSVPLEYPPGEVVDDKMILSIVRPVLKMWYEWRFEGDESVAKHNCGGADHCLTL